VRGLELDLGKRIDERLHSYALILLLESSFPSLIIDNHRVASVVLEMLGPSPRMLGRMMSLSKGLSKCLAQDVYWTTNVSLGSAMWEGVGRDGSAAEEWRKYREFFGLPARNVLRIRNLNHSSSRLKLYYGTLSSQALSSPSQSSSFLDPSDLIMACVTPCEEGLGSSSIPRGHIRQSTVTIKLQDDPSQIAATPLLVVIGVNTSDASRRFFRRLSFFLPDSALFPLDPPPYASLCKETGGFLFSIEPSSLSKQRLRANRKDDPGILVEGVSQASYYRDGETIELRRIGDQRMSIVEFQHRMGGSKHVDELLSTSLMSRARAYIVVLDARESDETLHSQLREVLDTYILHQRSAPLSTRAKGQYHHRSQSLSLPPVVGKTQSSIEDKPLIIFVSIDTRFVHHPNDVNNIVLSVKMAAEKTLRGHYTSAKIKWFVQPFDERAAEDCMGKGIGAGINWMTRVLNNMPSHNRSGGR